MTMKQAEAVLTLLRAYEARQIPDTEERERILKAITILADGVASALGSFYRPDPPAVFRVLLQHLHIRNALPAVSVNLAPGLVILDSSMGSVTIGYAGTEEK